MKIVIFLFLSIFFYSNVYGQVVSDSVKFNKNHIDLEIGGVGLFVSINYEGLILKKSNNKLLFRIGLGFIPLNSDFQGGSSLLPFGLYYLIGNKHHVEIGLNNSFGYTISNLDNVKSGFHYLFSPSIGYRFENFIRKSFYFNLAYSPVLWFSQSATYKFGLQQWAKAGVGYSF